jgi:hypothetical protein
LDGKVTMKIGVWSGLVLTLFVSHIVRADPEPKKFTTVGSFSSMEFTEAHQYGSEVQLWKEGSNVLGLFSYSESLIGDTPTGLLEDTKYDPRTGEISFKAKLTTGQHFCEVYNDVPSHDLFSFRGKLSDSSISGLLKRSDALHPEDPPTEEKVVLKKLSGDEANQIHYGSRSEWEIASQEILKFRGPKW